MQTERAKINKNARVCKSGNLRGKVRSATEFSAIFLAVMPILFQNQSFLGGNIRYYRVALGAIYRVPVNVREIESGARVCHVECAEAKKF